MPAHDVISDEVALADDPEIPVDISPPDVPQLDLDATNSRNLREDVVISGISCRLPESDNMAEFREHLMKGEDMVTEDARRWEPGKAGTVVPVL